MIVIRWRDGPPNKWCDLLPSNWFIAQGSLGARDHWVCSASGDRLLARCEVTVSERAAVLDYGGAHAVFNEGQGVTVGQLRLTFADGNRSTAQVVEWRTSKAEEWKPSKVAVSSSLSTLPVAAFTSERLMEGEIYSRPELAEAFSITDATVNTGVFRPAGTRSIWLFVTHDMEVGRALDANRLDGDVLTWLGQNAGRTDGLISGHEAAGNEVLLFYRAAKRSHWRAGFRYEGRFRYISHEAGPPSRFRLGRIGSTAPRGHLAMLEDSSAIDTAMNAWLQALTAAARPISTSRGWLDAQAIMFKRRASLHRPGAWDVALGVRSNGEPWTIELNAPAAAMDANGLTTVAMDEAGRHFLVRQGRLRPNPDSAGEVVGADFQRLSGLLPVKVEGGKTPTPREWYMVAPLAASAEQIRDETGEFVHACARARLGSRGVSLPSSAPPLIGGDETGGMLTRRASDARAEQVFCRLHGEVWLALRRHLEAAGVEMLKLRHEAGYEVDAAIRAPKKSILLEIKTGSSSADVYEGVGQLMLYSRMLGLDDHERILLLPAPPSPTLVTAMKACDLEVHCYSAEGAEKPHISFSPAFLRACGA